MVVCVHEHSSLNRCGNGPLEYGMMNGQYVAFREDVPGELLTSSLLSATPGRWLDPRRGHPSYEREQIGGPSDQRSRAHRRWIAVALGKRRISVGSAVLRTTTATLGR